MTDVSVPAENSAATPEARRPFVTPVVENLGHLRALTQLQGVTL
jgi:hypothetical protein